MACGTVLIYQVAGRCIEIECEKITLHRRIPHSRAAAVLAVLFCLCHIYGSTGHFVSPKLPAIYQLYISYYLRVPNVLSAMYSS